MKISAFNSAVNPVAKSISKYVKENRQRSIAIAITVVVGIAGLAAIQLSNAATYVVALEAESGTRSGTTTVVNAPFGASGNAVQFGGGTTPTPTPPPPTPTPPTPPPAGGRASGLPWSSGVWNKEDPNYTKQYIASPRGGVPLDNVMEYTHRDSHASQLSSVGQFASKMPAGFNAARDDFILSVTSWAIDGSSMSASQASQIGAATCKIDSSPIVRLDWEMNLPGGPGHNGASLNSGNYSQWVSRFRTVATSMKSACPGLRIDFNPNHGADQTSGCGGSPAQWCSRRAFQELKSVIDIFGIDTYDAWATMDTILNGSGELNDSYAYAAANGKKFSVPEWGIWSSSAGVPLAKGDNPAYINTMVDWFNSHASGMAYETYFGFPDSWINSDLVASNPQSRAAMAAKLKQYSTKY